MGAFRVIFVVDILNGTVVHAIKGERENYHPIHHRSRIVDTSDPVNVIKVVNPHETYVADLDAIMRVSAPRSNSPIIACIREETNTSVILDMGIRSVDDLEFASSISDFVVIGTETATYDVIEAASGMDAFVSFDMKNHKIITRDSRLRISPYRLIEWTNTLNLAGIIILNLSNVGTKRGFDIGFLEKIVEISEHPIFLGGGVRCVDDLRLLEEIGVEGALVATAIHDGTIPCKLIQDPLSLS
ncbi:MAG: phosphoribosylformimino-5-aminoimidazole carboxamide ribotide isomerase [Candidatus Syntrophoarchaeum caldarius]|uniref:Phosphoribosylformimino-5-aminoimidazole carboxamide ribotide isomerase n=1 Tax=Candidatus Syntropharchaeum caldarium TaxID=1838285 RepID=A0A1F2PDK6_9EURY|nr:MAG: phosphoribosylformimino-5-aminoimidazole carboxamide ribotide isomerase [Candidatus Syntrophoarchaeum caldarius]